MSEAVLVLDRMPDSCKECILVDNREYYSPITERWEKWHCRKSCNPIDIESDVRPNWCPLRLFPEKYEPIDCKGACDVEDYYDGGLVDGWNACINDILGESYE